MQTEQNNPEVSVKELPVEDPVSASEETVSEENTENDSSAKKEKKKTPMQEVLSWVLTIAVAVAAALLIRTFLFEPVKVDGESMCDTLQNAEVMIVTKPEYLFGKPQRGDVVICHYPNRKSTHLLGIQTDTNFVKRVIGIPGDSIRIVENIVYVNGQPLDEPFLTEARNTGRWYKNSRYGVDSPVVLGENEYFVMGDNRDNSNDSRYIGPITGDMIIGHVHWVVFPFNSIRAIE